MRVMSVGDGYRFLLLLSTPLTRHFASEGTPGSMGRAYPDYEPVLQRVAERVATLNRHWIGTTRGSNQAEETEQGTRQAMSSNGGISERDALVLPRKHSGGARRRFGM